MAVFIERYLFGFVPIGASEIYPNDGDSFIAFGMDMTPYAAWIGRQKVSVEVDNRSIAHLKFEPLKAVPNQYLGYLKPDWIKNPLRSRPNFTLVYGDHRDYAGMLTRIRVVSK